MDNEIRLNDIANELLILNKTTIDTLFRLENCSDCIALYVFYYKTAKWQKTDTIKANDVYIQKSLKWGSKKIRETKKTLKEHGLIDIVQRRNNGKIEGWYVRVSYLVSQRKTENISINVEDTASSNNAQKQQVAEATSGFEETNALKEKIKCLEKEIEMLKKKESKKTTFDELIETYTSDPTVINLLKEWLKVRKAKRAALTDRAIELNLKKLNKLATESKMDVSEYLEEVISRGWAAFYKINNYDSKPNASNTYKRVEVVPDWINKEMKKESLSADEQKEMNDLLKEFKDPDFEARRTALQERLKQKYKKA